ncbi:iron-siderophore ABC transporter substrate-binding protein [Falsarthrobacter nasiphocae]|uniref:Iron complex transport system substrate-binding protein n=1 Tax=Falsarthrobacter nasiphocae TaxID=189863 RepID=A0AAE3YHE0_9MICC|nr:iron-siderophore ABC transporter substrate-binding protein [Falsarthrobacter nasiphocae]MDR6892249.1 iron complex transport system substrate-binding protein [Falsarthrobacter nasiphocae]
MDFSRRTGLLAFGSLTAAALLSACSTGSSDKSASSPSGSAAADSGAFPVTIEHAFGSTEIKAEPKRVATISWVNADVVLALGVVPVAMAKDTFGQNEKGSLPWKDEALEKLGAPIGSDKAPVQYSDADGINFDALAKATPDLIVGVYSGMTKEDYEKLSKIAPTIAYPEVAWGTSWQDSLTIVGKALGRSGEAKRLLDEGNAKLEKVKKDHPDFADKTFIFANLTPGKTDGVAAYTSIDNRPRFMESLGFKPAQVVVDAEKKAGEKKFNVQFSAENSKDLASDILLTWVPDAKTAEAIKKDKLLSQIPAVKRNAAVFDSNNTTTIALSAISILSMQYAIDNYVPKIAEAVKNA